MKYINGHTKKNRSYLNDNIFRGNVIIKWNVFIHFMKKLGKLDIDNM